MGREAIPESRVNHATITRQSREKASRLHGLRSGAVLGKRGRKKRQKRGLQKKMQSGLAYVRKMLYICSSFRLSGTERGETEQTREPERGETEQTREPERGETEETREPERGETEEIVR